VEAATKSRNVPPKERNRLKPEKMLYQGRKPILGHGFGGKKGKGGKKEVVQNGRKQWRGEPMQSIGEELSSEA